MASNKCPECGVPMLVTSEHLWLDNGDIVQARDRNSRIIFMETENLTPIFRSLEEILGVPVEHMVITVARRAYRVYLRAFIPERVLEKIRRKEMDYEPVDAAFRELGKFNGAGRYELVKRRYERDDDDYDTVSVSEPYCLPLCVAAHVGAIEAITGRDQGYSYREVGPDLYHITAFPSPHPEELKDRLRFRPYEHREGSTELDRCATCGGPRALAEFRWHPDRGVILSGATGRRICIQGNALLEPVFQELEEELGESIPRAVVEAQRRFVTGGFYGPDDVPDEDGFRTYLALRGLGSLGEMRMERSGMRLRVENVAMHLLVAGLAQGFYELRYGTGSEADWQLTGDGTLELEVRPR